MGASTSVEVASSIFDKKQTEYMHPAHLEFGQQTQLKKVTEGSVKLMPGNMYTQLGVPKQQIGDGKGVAGMIQTLESPSQNIPQPQVGKGEHIEGHIQNLSTIAVEHKNQQSPPLSGCPMHANESGSKDMSVFKSPLTKPSKECPVEHGGSKSPTPKDIKSYPRECPMHQGEQIQQSYPSECPMSQGESGQKDEFIRPSFPSECPMHQAEGQVELNKDNMVNYFYFLK